MCRIVLLRLMPGVKSQLPCPATVERNHAAVRAGKVVDQLGFAFLDAGQRSHVDRYAWRVVEKRRRRAVTQDDPEARDRDEAVQFLTGTQPPAPAPSVSSTAQPLANHSINARPQCRCRSLSRLLLPRFPLRNAISSNGLSRGPRLPTPAFSGHHATRIEDYLWQIGTTAGAETRDFKRPGNVETNSPAAATISGSIERAPWESQFSCSDASRWSSLLDCRDRML